MLFSEKPRTLKSSKNTILFEANKRYFEPIFDISQNDTDIIIERGAVVRGKLLVHDCQNVRIYGFGKITMEDYDWDIRPVERRRALEVINCKNVQVLDITISDSVDWNLRVMGTDNALVDNIKIIGHRGNSDGVDICGSRDVEVCNTFTRVWDDSNVSKALGTGDQRNVVFHDNVTWNDFARPLEVGGEGRADNVSNITFRDIDVIHALAGYTVMGVHHGDHAKVRNVLFENIRIEDAPGAEIFDAYIKHTFWNRDKDTGDIEGITVRNITCVDASTMSNPTILGMDAEHTIRDITFDNIDLGGFKPKSIREMGIEANEFVSGITFVGSEGHQDEIVSTTVKLDDITYNDGIYKGIAIITFTNEGSTDFSGNASLQINPVNLAKYDDYSFNLTIPAGKIVTKTIPVVLQAGKYLFSVASPNTNLKRSWVFKDLCLTLNMGSSITLDMCNYYGYHTPLIITPQRDGLMIDTKLKNVIVYACEPVALETNQVLFTVEETDFGEAPAIINGPYGLEASAILRCPLEITYVFKNEPKVKAINRVELKKGFVSYAELGVDRHHFWLEITGEADETKDNRYPLSLFHSVKPELTSHMFGNIFVLGD